MSSSAGKDSEDSFALSYELRGHSGDVRAVQYCPWRGSPHGHCILTASRDGTACVWVPDTKRQREYFLHKVVKKHTGFVTALCAIPSTETEEGASESKCCK